MSRKIHHDEKSVEMKLSVYVMLIISFHCFPLLFFKLIYETLFANLKVLYELQTVAHS